LRDGARLLVDLLEHVMRVIALFRRIGREFALVDLAVHGRAVVVEDPEAFAAHFRHVAFLENGELVRHGQQRGDVRGDEVLAVADADDDRAALARQDDAFRIVLRDHCQRIGAFELRHRGTHRLEQVARLLQVIVNPMRDDFRVRLGAELVTGGLQFVAQLVVVLDDAVVNDRNPVARDVRMRVALARHAVRGPARVRDAERTVRRIGVDRILQHADLADGAQPLDRTRAVEHGDPCRVVAAILETTQAFDQDRDDITLGNGTDDSAHAGDPSCGGARLAEFLANQAPAGADPPDGTSHGP
jgi:hypothetical protein